MQDNENKMKKAAAESAAALVKDGMVVGLGTGSTAKFAVSELGRRVAGGLRIVGIPTSEATAAQARSLEIPLTTLAEQPGIDLTIDGADEVEEGTLNLVKGLGGALLREKIVASATKRLVIVVHGSKVVSRLATGPVPVEVVTFGWQSTARRLTSLGAKPTLRLKADGEPFRTDGGNYIVDCAIERGALAKSLASGLDHIVGVVEHGLFIGLTSEVHVAESSGVRVLTTAR